MAICREAVRSDEYKSFGVSNRGSEEEVASLLQADCVRRVSDNLAFAYFYDPEPEDEGRGVSLRNYAKMLRPVVGGGAGSLRGAAVKGRTVYKFAGKRCASGLCGYRD